MDLRSSVWAEVDVDVLKRGFSFRTLLWCVTRFTHVNIHRRYIHCNDGTSLTKMITKLPSLVTMESHTPLLPGSLNPKHSV